MSSVGQLQAETIARATLVARFVNFRQEVNERSSRGVDDEISGSVR